MALSTDSRFFGLDLNQLKTDITKAWRKAPQWPPLSWLRPEQLLTLVPAQGDATIIWESGIPAKANKRNPEFWAIELPESMVLRKVLQLPPLDPQDCASAAQLEAQAISPFAGSDLLWGATEILRSDKLVRLQMVLASRAQAEPYIQSRVVERIQMQGEGSAKQLPQPEVWVFAPERRPVVLQGFGESTRAAAGRKKLLWNALGIGVALLLLLGIAITPTVQLRFRAIEAVKAFDVMAAKTGDAVTKREQLMQSADKVAGLSELLAERIDGVKVLSMLTEVLQDDSALQSARIQGNKVTITGLTENASTLMQKLSNQEGIKDVRAPSAATRLGGVNRESFTIELTLDAKIFGPTVKPDESVAKPDSAEAGNTMVPTAGAPSPVSSPSVAEQVAPPPATDPKSPAGPSLGGSAPSKSALGEARGPTLGGSRPQPAQGAQ